MFDSALKLGAVTLALAAAMPAGAVVEIAAPAPVARALAAAPVRLAGQPAYYSSAWYSADYGKLVVMADLPAASYMASAPAPMLITERTASILAAPLSWAMMTTGLLAIGWTMRSRLKVTNVSFV